MNLRINDHSSSQVPGADLGRGGGGGAGGGSIESPKLKQLTSTTCKNIK